MKLLDPILSLIYKENGKHHKHESCCDEHESACSCCDGGHEHQHTYKGGLDPVIALRVVVSAVLLLLSVLLSKTELWKTILLAIAALLAGYDVIIRAVKHAIHKHIMDENLLMTVSMTRLPDFWITVHRRTRSLLLRAITEKLRIPVLPNGTLWSVNFLTNAVSNCGRILKLSSVLSPVTANPEGFSVREITVHFT